MSHVRNAATLSVGSIALLAIGVVWRSASPIVDSLPPSIPQRISLSDMRPTVEPIGTESARWMPEELRGLYLGMSLSALRRARPAMHESRRAGPDTRLWEETLAGGARVIAEVSSLHESLDKVQVLSRLEDVTAIRGHFNALRSRYGSPTGFWDCPERPHASALRRITWRGDGVTLTEAILVYGSGVSVTLVVSTSEEVARALSASTCVPVTNATLADWPIARTLGGESAPTMEVR